MMCTRSLVAVAALLLSTSAVAQVGAPFPLVPRQPTGLSGIEQRYVYAPPDEGEFSFDLTLGMGAPTEVLIAEPSMCEGSANVTIKYSKAKNKVWLNFQAHGLPYRMSYAREKDISNEYNQFPVSIEEGVWQIWFVTRMLNFDTNYYYDAGTLKLIGSEFDYPVQPPNSFAVPLPTLHMIASPLFEGTPGLQANVTFEFDYDRMLDEQGKGGVYFSYAPYDLCKPDQYGGYYTDGGLPVEKAPSFDHVLESIWSGHQMVIATSLEPRVKPEYLLSRDNTMIGWANMYPASVPPGTVLDLVNGTYVLANECKTHLARDYAKAHYNICGGFDEEMQ